MVHRQSVIGFDHLAIVSEDIYYRNGKILLSFEFFDFKSIQFNTRIALQLNSNLSTHPTYIVHRQSVIGFHHLA